jgi:hypothetical protein
VTRFALDAGRPASGDETEMAVAGRAPEVFE